MQQRVIIHIGVPKTGTTAVQKFLCDNRNALLGAGWLYPGNICRGFGQHDLAFLLGGGYPEWATVQPRSLAELLALLRQEITSVPHRQLLISSENFYLLCSPQALADCLRELGYAPGEVGIVVYLRRQDDAVESWYNQAVKAQGYAGTLSEHAAAAGDLWDYATRLARWAEVFGADNMSVHCYSTGGDVRHDFLRVLGIGPADFVFSDTRENREINRDILEFQRLLNCEPLEIQEKRRFHRQLIALSAEAHGSGIFCEAPCMDRDMRAQIMAAHAVGNAHVAERYFGRSVLFAETGQVMDGEAAGTEYRLTADKEAYIRRWLAARINLEQA